MTVRVSYVLAIKISKGRQGAALIQKCKIVVVYCL